MYIGAGKPFGKAKLPPQPKYGIPRRHLGEATRTLVGRNLARGHVSEDFSPTRSLGGFVPYEPRLNSRAPTSRTFKTVKRVKQKGREDWDYVPRHSKYYHINASQLTDTSLGVKSSGASDSQMGTSLGAVAVSISRRKLNAKSSPPDWRESDVFNGNRHDVEVMQSMMQSEVIPVQF